MKQSFFDSVGSQMHVQSAREKMEYAFKPIIVDGNRITTQKRIDDGDYAVSMEGPKGQRIIAKWNKKKETIRTLSTTVIDKQQATKLQGRNINIMYGLIGISALYVLSVL